VPTVILADDALLLREALADLLSRNGFHVIAQVGDAEALHRAVAGQRPDVVVVDVRMPPEHRLEGLRAAVDLRRQHPGMGVLVLSQHVESQYLPALLGGNARGVGYLLKERVAGAGAFVDAVRAVATGGCVVDQQVVATMMRARRGDDPLARLSDREREILALIAQGRSNQAICNQFRLTKKTVETHVRNIFTRLDLLPEDDDNRRVLAVLSYLRPWSEAAYRAGLPIERQP
jgi:DNA-binding NarL/FixJ family response regulator